MAPMAMAADKLTYAGAMLQQQTFVICTSWCTLTKNTCILFKVLVRQSLILPREFCMACIDGGRGEKEEDM